MACSEGRKLLLGLLETTTQCAVAAVAKVTQPAVAGWASGASRPSYRPRMLLLAAYGIEHDAWDREQLGVAAVAA